MITRLTLLLFAVVGVTACGRSAPNQRAEAEMPTLDVTHWTEQTELFMEYPPLVTGRSALFAVHLTKLDRFHAR